MLPGRKDSAMDECCDINTVVRETYGQLLNYLKKQTSDKSVAEDITQDVMLKLVRAHADNHLLVNPRAWLFEVARNQLTEHYRVKKAELFSNGDYPEDATLIEDILTEPGPQDMLPYMVRLLPPLYGEPLAMSDLYNYPAKKIAAQLGISLSATKMRVQRARKMLQNLFNECCEIEYTKSGKFSHCTVRDNCTPLIKIAEKLTH